MAGVEPFNFQLGREQDPERLIDQYWDSQQVLYFAERRLAWMVAFSTSYGLLLVVVQIGCGVVREYKDGLTYFKEESFAA